MEAKRTVGGGAATVAPNPFQKAALNGYDGSFALGLTVRGARHMHHAMQLLLGRRVDRGRASSAWNPGSGGGRPHRPGDHPPSSAIPIIFPLILSFGFSYKIFASFGDFGFLPLSADGAPIHTPLNHKFSCHDCGFLELRYPMSALAPKAD